MDKKTRGQCPHCGDFVPLSPDRLTIYHGDRRTMQGDCLGSRQEPGAPEAQNEQWQGDSDGPTWSDYGGWIN